MNERYDELADEQISRLYQKIQSVEPPDWLDRRVLIAATAAVQPTVAQVPSKRRTPRWTAPLALAATVVITVGLVRLMPQSSELQAPLRSEAAKPRVHQEAKQDALASQRLDAATSADARLQSAPAAVAPPAVVLEAPISQPLGKTEESYQPAILPPPPSEVSASSRAAPATPTAPANSMTPRRKAAEEPQKKLESLQMTPASKPAEPAIADQGMLVRRAPKQWLQAIAELRRQGRISEADAELAEFKRQYPHHPFDLDRPTP